ncbi:MAG: MFS transporter [Actinomycetota bacterium]|nr:MFS transporter [Actinomycetota bacterium]
MDGNEARLSSDFWKFWVGQTVSKLGDSISWFALPLLVFKLTGSALNLGLTTAAQFVPYLLFGLFIGAYVDRVQRKRMMVFTDLGRMTVMASVPLLATFGLLHVWWIYAVAFISSTQAIFFDSGEFAAIPSLVSRDDLVTANGRIQASYSAAQVVGPLVGGALLAVNAVYNLIWVDACSFALSAASIAWVKKSFNEEPADETKEPTTIMHDVKEGLTYVLSHPVLRNISIMMALVNFVAATTYTQLVLFAKDRLAATDSQVGMLFAAGSAGIVVTGLVAGKLRKRWSFSRVALGALFTSGLFILFLSMARQIWVAIPLWAAASGLGILFNINTGSLRQAIVPNRLLGRVMSIASVLAWSAIPVGALLGGYLIETTGRPALVYAGIGIITAIIPVAFSLTALGHAEDYLPETPASEEEDLAPVT